MFCGPVCAKVKKAGVRAGGVAAAGIHSLALIYGISLFLSISYHDYHPVITIINSYRTLTMDSGQCFFTYFLIYFCRFAMK